MTESPAQKSPSEDTETPSDPPPMIIEPLAPPYRVVLYFRYEELRERFDQFWDEYGEALIRKFKVKTRKQKGGKQPSARRLIEKKFTPTKLYGDVLSKLVTEKVKDDIMFLEGLALFNYPPTSALEPWPQLVAVVYFVPDLKMHGTINWAVKQPPTPPEEEEWERRVAEVQRQYRVIEPDEDGVDITEDHQVLCDVTASIDGEPYERGTFQGHWLEVGIIHIPELKAALLEHKKGDLFETEFDPIRDPAMEGKRIKASVKVHDLKIIRTPEVDDELAKDAGYEDMADFRKRFRRDYKKYVENSQRATATNHVIGQILMQSRIPAFPEEWIERNIERMINEHLQHFKGDRKRAMMAVGVDNEEDFRHQFKGQLYREYMQQLAARLYCKMYEIKEPGSDEMFESILSQVRWINDNEEEKVAGVGG